MCGVLIEGVRHWQRLSDRLTFRKGEVRLPPIDSRGGELVLPSSPPPSVTSTRQRGPPTAGQEVAASLATRLGVKSGSGGVRELSLFLDRDRDGRRTLIFFKAAPLLLSKTLSSEFYDRRRSWSRTAAPWGVSHTSLPLPNLSPRHLARLPSARPLAILSPAGITVRHYNASMAVNLL
ncbi:hypothetical protein Sjap_011219 [Stephania japonica]|uniref:Uncharacterized protein n=1 Tax=Stephania japonica TaxID=461633 RepID=A0AAP0P4J2_9MAGN